MSADKPTICAECRHMGQGYVKRDVRGYEAHSNAICLAQPHSIGEVDLVDGSGGGPRDATPCRDVNDGACPDFRTSTAGVLAKVYVVIIAVCSVLGVAVLIMATLAAAGVMP